MNRMLQITLALTGLALLVTGCGTGAEPRVITLAGSEGGYADGSGVEAQFSGALDVAVDPEGNVYVADSANHRIRKITPDGTVTTLVGGDQPGYTDGPISEAVFSDPTGVALAASGDLYVAEYEAGEMRVRIITPEGTVTTLPTHIENRGFEGRSAIVIDGAGNVYLANTFTHRIYRINLEGKTTTLAGPAGVGYAAGYADGPAAEARFHTPCGVAVDGAGNVYVADSDNHCVRCISPDGQVTTLAGAKEPGYVDGQGSEARFSFPRGIAVDTEGNLYVADTANHRIRKITPDGTVTTLAGSGEPGDADGSAGEAQFRIPEGITVDPDGNVIVADTGNHRIRKIVLNP